MSSSNLVSITQVAVETGIVLRTELAWPLRAEQLTIIDALTLATADEERGACKDLIAQAHLRHDPTCASAYQTWQLALAERTKDIDPLETAIRTFDQKMKDWDRAEKQRARETQRAIEAAAHTEVVVEREKVVEHVEATGGSVGEVKSVAERPINVPVAPTQVMRTAAAPVKAKKSVVVEDWKGEITDVWALVTFALLGANPPKEVLDWVDAHKRRELVAMLQADKVAVGSMARTAKDTLEVPGVRIWDEGKVQSLAKKGA